jgi:RHS repeat-associated protein
VPDVYRTTLAIQYKPIAAQPTMVVNFFTDEIYGRPLQLGQSGIIWDHVGLKSVAGSLPQCGVSCVPPNSVVMTINHPYVAKAGTYGDSTVTRSIVSVDSMVVVLGFGSTSPALPKKWTQEHGPDIDNGSEYSRGDGRRMNLSAEWLAQFSRARSLHEAIGRARVNQLHSLGILYTVYNSTAASTNRTNIQNVADIETTVAVAVRDNNIQRRRAIIQALAATAATLEGSVAEQLANTPASSSTSRRFAWANTPGNAPSGTPKFYTLAAGSATPAVAAFVENGAGPSQVSVLRSALTAYLGQGFAVTAASDAQAGPGSTLGDYLGYYGGSQAGPSNERGGAFVAVRYDAAGDPSEIAHVVTNFYSASKGGGAAVQAGTPPNAAEMMRDSFQDRSSVLGIDLSSGTAGYSTPVLSSVGQGEFPYKLEERLELRGGGAAIAMPDAPGNGFRQNTGNPGLVSNFDSVVRLTNSGFDAMGAASPEAAAGTIVAFIALQDVYEAAPSADMTIVGALVADWWGRRLMHNVVSVAQGGRTETYVDAGEIESGKRVFRSATGTARAYLQGEPRKDVPPTPDGFVGYSERYIDWDLTFEVVGTDESRRTFEPTPSGIAGSFLSTDGQRLKKWAFSEGVELVINYAPYPADTVALPTSVSSNIGHTLTLSTVPRQIQDGLDTSSSLYPCAGFSTTPTQFYLVADAGGRIHRSRYRQPQGQTLYQRPDPFCRLAEVYSPQSATAPAIQYEYDALNRIKTAKDAIAIASPSVRGSHQFFIAEGFRGQREDPLGGRYTVETLSNGRASRHIDEEGRVSLASFDGRGRITSRTAAWGNRTEFEYDERDNVTLVRRRPLAGCGADPWWCQVTVVTATYNAWNKPTAIVLPATADGQVSHSWTFGYDIQGRLITQTSPTVHNGKTGGYEPAIWRTRYDAYGRVTQTRDPTGIEATMTYGGYGQPAWCLTRQIASSQSGGSNQVSAFTCNAAGDVVTATNPRNNVTTFTYDALRRRTSETGPAGTGIQTQWAYDADGNPTEERRWDSAASVWRTSITTYSLTGKPLTITDPAGDVSRTCYDGLDRATVAVDPTGRATRTTYNAAGQPTLIERWFEASLSDPTCALTNTRPAEINTNRWREFQYNAGGLQSAEIDGNGNVTTMIYEGLGRHMLTVYADGRYDQTMRNERDQVVVTYRRNGEVVRSIMDELGRPYWVWENSGAWDWSAGRHTRTSFDLAGRPVWTAVSTQAGGTYDPALERDIRTYGYDDAGRVIADRVQPNNGSMGTSQLILSYEYDRANNRTGIVWPDGYRATYRYDAANRADRVQFGPSGNPTQHQADITHDSLSRRTGLNRSNGVNTAYAYETDSDLSQLNHVWAPGAGQTPATFGFQHDGAGRITLTQVNRSDLEWMPTLAEAASYGVPTNLNQTTSVNGVGLRWDPKGNLDQHGTTDYRWTLGNRLWRVVRPASTTEYAYDSTDRRTMVIEDGVMTRTLWSGADEVGEYDAAGALQRRFIPDGSGAMDARLAMVSSTGDVSWFHTNHQGSVIAMSNASGAATGFANYSEYGKFGTNAAGSPLNSPPGGSPFGYTGRQWDAKAGLYQYRARYYDPVLGVFLSMDPIGTKDDPNLYMYVGLDPVNKTDPTGLYECTAGRARCARVEAAIRRIAAEAEKYEEGSTQRNALEQVVAHFGEAGVENGVVVRAAGFRELRPPNPANTRFRGGQNTEITIDFNQIGGRDNFLAGVVAHEGNHSYRYRLGIQPEVSLASGHRFELPAYRTQYWLWAAMGYGGYSMSTPQSRIEMDAGVGAGLSAAHRCKNTYNGCSEQQRPWY